MNQDPHIRSYRESAPIVPGTRIRFRWPEHGDICVQRIRTEVQEEGRGLYVLQMPAGSQKAIVEAYYPEGIRTSFYEAELDPARREDVGAGRLVVVHVWRVLSGPVDSTIIAELRRNNRSSREDLSRTSTASNRRLELEHAEEATEDAAFAEFRDAYADASLETAALTKVRNTSTKRLA